MTMPNINELEQLAKAAPAAFYLDSDDGLDREFNGIDSFSCGRNGGVPLYAFDPSAILELITAYREAVAALSDPALYCSDTTYCDEFCCREKQRNALATAKRLGVK